MIIFVFSSMHIRCVCYKTKGAARVIKDYPQKEKKMVFFVCFSKKGTSLDYFLMNEGDTCIYLHNPSQITFKNKLWVIVFNAARTGTHKVTQQASTK